MIKALLLLINPVGTWDGIVSTRRRWPLILLGFLFPLWLVAFVAEGYGLVHWGKPQGVIASVKVFTHSEALIFEILQLFLMLVAVFVSARLIKALGQTFHGRNTFAQAFTVVAYGLSPLFTVRILDVFPGVSGWTYWGVWMIGIFLSLGLFYHGIPKVMLPDPAHALGLYLISSVFLLMVTGFARFLTYSYLAGKFGKLDALIAGMVAHSAFLQSFDQMHFFK